VGGCNSSVANRKSRLPLESRFSNIEVALAASIKALAAFKSAVAESKGQIPSACREPKQGSGRGGCGNERGEVGVAKLSGLPELIAGRGAGSSCLGEQDAAQRPGLPGLIAELARPGANPISSAGSAEETPWSFLWQIKTVCTPGAEEAAMAPRGTAQDITEQRAGAAVDEQEA
jgi:hypothetical protein